MSTVPESVSVLAKKPGADGTNTGVLVADIVIDVGMLDGFRERDGVFAALPQDDDIFGELHTKGRVSPWGKAQPAEVREAALFDKVGQ